MGEVNALPLSVVDADYCKKHISKFFEEKKKLREKKA